MVFSSLIFVFTFLPLALVGYYLAPKRWRNAILLVASLVFYSWGEPVYVLLMILTTALNYLGSRVLDWVRATGKQRVLRLSVLLGILVVDLGVLGFFKYYGFVIDTVNTLLGTDWTAKTLPLPLGISFYTFQSISYILDLYWGKVPLQRNFIAFSTYIAMFPQLVAGPIVRYSEIREQLESRRTDWVLFGEGAEQFIIGLAKKVLLANNIGILWESVRSIPSAELSVLAAWLGILAFTFQIYFDFSGYSDMAVGLGKMFGFKLPRNFNYPYIAGSITEFWRRWHITLGAWFREYLYIPLGGNRQGFKKQLRNLLIVWFLTGLWHGASWNFVIWGLYFGVLLFVEKMVLLKWLEKRARWLGHFYTLLAIIVGWVIFEFEQVGAALGFIALMFGLGGNALYDGTALYYLYTNALLFIVLAVCATPCPKRLLDRFKETQPPQLTPNLDVISCLGTQAQSGENSASNRNTGVFQRVGAPLGLTGGYLLLLILCTAYMVTETYNPFLYFRF